MPALVTKRTISGIWDIQEVNLQISEGNHGNKVEIVGQLQTLIDVYSTISVTHWQDVLSNVSIDATGFVQSLSSR